MDNLNVTSNQKIEFEDQYERPSGYYNQKKTSKIIALIIKFSGGHIKNEQQANYVLIIFAVAAIIISIILFSRLSPTSPKAVQFREDIPLELRKNLSPEVLETIPSKFK
ncbi:MAG: hypothetical protein A2V96_00460 [Candidatus Yonathbacteria bacterium RBG_16_43_6]|uniref:Uncharacterized protein n=1 Tax=Candidatus Azambacteria bacterium GW2011_GWA1_44_9 TaxID=1618610 RepID=A0A0G1KEF1_9BACT|nr:MAG: hypothetical protein UW78_C0004G0021 [Candidatus Azambacteria bacterium GW2011_GWA1_44_9]OHA79202.1 MAG: hypothetical protein A2V96_00460 [Candidatus Yonathbacteria bacterium RBG_16_43_6]OHA79233.1 MAG: hypothetical protein A2658_02710 [Candidatus Yonathbacteria bacterium RIFCSPHIGHO2_01_FULL_44_19]